MGSVLSEMWRRLRSAWRSWRRTPLRRDVVDAGMRQEEPEDVSDSEGEYTENAEREVDTGAAREKTEQADEDGGGCWPVEAECVRAQPPDRAGRPWGPDR